MCIEVFNTQKPLDEETAHHIGQVRYHASADRGIPLLAEPNSLISSFATEAIRSAKLFNLAIFKDVSHAILGFCVWRHSSDKQVTFMRDLYTLPHPKNISVGTPLVEYVQQEVLALDYKYIHVTASTYSIKNKFYQNRGFTFKDNQCPPHLNRQMIWRNPNPCLLPQ